MILFNVIVSSTCGLDVGELQLAFKTSPGSYRSRSAHNIGRLTGNSAKKKKGMVMNDY